LNSDKCHNNCLLDDLRILEPHKEGCKTKATHFTNMATGHNRFLMVAEISSYVPWKTATPLSPWGEYPKLQNLSNNLTPPYYSATRRRFSRSPRMLNSIIAYAGVVCPISLKSDNKCGK